MSHFKIRYTLNNEPMAETIEATSPISALDKFHRSMQLVSGINHKKYKIASLASFYPLDPQGTARLGFHESRYDLPHGDNPNLSLSEEVIPEPPTLAFMDNLENGRLAE